MKSYDVDVDGQVSICCMAGTPAHDEIYAGRTPLMVAAARGQADIVEELLRRPGIDINAKTSEGKGALDFACRNGHMRVVQLLVAAGARVNPKPSTWWRAFWPAWVTPEASDDWGPLSSAAFGGSLRIVKYLIEEAGADARRAGPGGQTPLMVAAREGQVPIVKYLLDRSGVAIDIDAKTADGRGALDFACRSGYLEMVKLLVGAGARVNPQAPGETGALASAAWGGNLQAVKYLVEKAGADVWRASPDGKTPRMVATDQGHADIEDYLRETEIRREAERVATPLEEEEEEESAEAPIAARNRRKKARRKGKKQEALPPASEEEEYEPGSFVEHSQPLDGTQAMPAVRLSLDRRQGASAPGRERQEQLGVMVMQEELGVMDMLIEVWKDLPFVTILLAGAWIGELAKSDRLMSACIISAALCMAWRVMRVGSVAMRYAGNMGHAAISYVAGVGHAAICCIPRMGRAAAIMGHAALCYVARTGHAATLYAPRMGRAAMSYVAEAEHATISYIARMGRAAAIMGHAALCYVARIGNAAMSYVARTGHAATLYVARMGHAAMSYVAEVGHATISYVARMGHAAMRMGHAALSYVARMGPMARCYVARMMIHGLGLQITAEASGDETANQGVQADLRVLTSEERVVTLEELSCPISFTLMTDPVVADDGHTYERDAIEQWIHKCITGGRPVTSPLTGAEMGPTLRQNHLVRSMIQGRQT